MDPAGVVPHVDARKVEFGVIVFIDPVRRRALLFAELRNDAQLQGSMIMPGLLNNPYQGSMTPENYYSGIANTVAQALAAAVSTQSDSGETAIYLDGERVGFAVLPSIRAAAAASPEVQML